MKRESLKETEGEDTLRKNQRSSIERETVRDEGGDAD